MAYSIPDFDICAVQRPDRERPVHGEFHVAGPRSLFARGGDLFAEVCGGIDLLPEGHVVVRQKKHFEAVFHVEVVVNHFADRINQLDDQLGHRVTGRRLAAKEEGTRRHLQMRVSLQALVKGDDLEHVQMLPLVFVYPLYLGIEHGAGVY